MANDHIQLADYVRELRSQLTAAIDEGEGQDLRFDVESLDLEFQTVVEHREGGKFSIKLWIANLSGEESTTGKVLQTVRLRLKPVGADGKSSQLRRGGK